MLLLAGSRFQQTVGFHTECTLLILSQCNTITFPRIVGEQRQNDDYLELYRGLYLVIFLVHEKNTYFSSFIFHISFQSLGWTKCSQLKLKESCRDHYYLPDILLRSSALLHMLNEGYSRTVFSLLLINMGRLQQAHYKQ